VHQGLKAGDSRKHLRRQSGRRRETARERLPAQTVGARHRIDRHAAGMTLDQMDGCVRHRLGDTRAIDARCHCPNQRRHTCAHRNTGKGREQPIDRRSGPDFVERHDAVEELARGNSEDGERMGRRKHRADRVDKSTDADDARLRDRTDHAEARHQGGGRKRSTGRPRIAEVHNE
jgi:hypothetical protein